MEKFNLKINSSYFTKSVIENIIIITMENLTENLKKAFDYKNDGLYKEAIDYFYKAFTIDNDSVEIMSELAHLYSKLNQIDRAIDFCEQILSKDPKDFEIRFYLVNLYKKLFNYEKAEQNLFVLFEEDAHKLRAAEELFSVLEKNNKPEKIIELFLANENELKSGEIYCFVANSYLAKGDREKADEFFKFAFELDETNVEAGSRVAEKLFQYGHYEETENLLNNLLKYSENDRIYFLLAEISYLKSQYDKAINYYTLALKLNDKNTQYYYKLGGLYVQKGFFLEAEECYNKAIYIEPDNLLYNYILAYLYFVNNKYVLSKHILEDILKRDSEYQDALSLKLQILLKENDLAHARSIVETLSKLEEKSERVYYSFALYYAGLNMWNKAVENIKQAILFNENSCEYNYELASYYFELKEYVEAEKVCNKIISINAKFIQAHILLAKLFVSMDDYEKAKCSIEKALILDLNTPEVHYLKGVVLEENNDKSRAIESYKIAVSMAPNKVEYYEAVADCYYSIKNYEDAYNYYKEASDMDVLNGKYHYQMAKCCEENGNIDSAISSYSMAKRLSPLNVQYVEDYAKVLWNNNKKKQAVSLLKASSKLFSADDKKRIKSEITNF